MYPAQQVQAEACLWKQEQGSDSSLQLKAPLCPPLNPVLVLPRYRDGTEDNASPASLLLF